MAKGGYFNNHDVENYPELLKQVLTITRILLQGRRPENPRHMTVMVQAKGHEASNARSMKETSCWSYWGGFSPSLRKLIPFVSWSGSSRQEILYWGEGRGDGMVFSFPSECNAPNKLAQWGSNYIPNSLKTLKDLTQACVQYGPAAL